MDDLLKLHDDCQSWEERCNRYFSSLSDIARVPETAPMSESVSKPDNVRMPENTRMPDTARVSGTARVSDTAKDHGQEKHIRESTGVVHKPNGTMLNNNRLDQNVANLDDDANNGHIGNINGGNIKHIPWRSVSEMKKLYSEHSLLRRIRNNMAVLDIHGSRMSYKANNAAEVVIWLAVVLIAIAATGYYAYVIVKDHTNQTGGYEVQKVENKDKFLVTFCNLNILKKSQVTENSRLYVLKNVSADGRKSSAYRPSSYTPVTMTFDDLIETGSQLSNRLVSKFGVATNDVLPKLRDKAVIKEMFRASNKTLMERLLAAGRPDLMLEVAGITRSEVRAFGYRFEDLVLDCWMDDFAYGKGHFSEYLDRELGRCFTFTATEDTRQLSLVLDALSTEYLAPVSPVVGIRVWLHRPGEDPTQGRALRLSAGTETSITVDQACLESLVQEVCDCTTGGGNSRCDMLLPDTYVCYKAVEALLQMKPEYCGCSKDVVETYTMNAQTVQWPSELYMIEQMKQTDNKRNVTFSYARRNYLKVTVDLVPKLITSVQRDEDRSVLMLLMRLGGMAAFIGGISVVTVLQMVYLSLKPLVTWVLQCFHRREGATGVQKLTDSEITSITWAMHRHRRLYEENNKQNSTDSDDKHTSPAKYAVSGNVKCRISKLNSFQNGGDQNNKGFKVGETQTGQTNDQYQTHDKGYSPRRYDSRQDWNLSRYRNSVESDGRGPYIIRTQIEQRVSRVDERDGYERSPRDSYSGDSLTYKYTGNFQSGFAMKQGNNRNIYQVRDNRLMSVAELEADPANDANLPKIEQENSRVQFYNGTSAYFTPITVSEPVYL